MNEKKIVIRRGTHPNEVSAFYLAFRVCESLKAKGYICVLETKPRSATAWGEMMTGTKAPFRFREKGRAYFSFHNSSFYDWFSGWGNYLFDYSGETCGGSPVVTVEIPAIYKEITNPQITAKRIIWADGNKTRISYADWYMKEVVDPKASSKKGAVDDIIVEEASNRIIQLTSEL